MREGIEGVRLLKHNGEGRVKTFSTFLPATSFSPVISKLQYIINDNLTFSILRCLLFRHCCLENDRQF